MIRGRRPVDGQPARASQKLQSIVDSPLAVHKGKPVERQGTQNFRSNAATRCNTHGPDLREDCRTQQVRHPVNSCRNSASSARCRSLTAALSHGYICTYTSASTADRASAFNSDQRLGCNSLVGSTLDAGALPKLVNSECRFTTPFSKRAFIMSVRSTHYRLDNRWRFNSFASITQSPT